MRGRLIYVPVETATTPANGECLVGQWWSTHPEKGVAFYVSRLLGPDSDDQPVPQCNSSEATARHLTKRLYPDHEVLHLPAVFMQHAIRELSRVRKEACAILRDKEAG